MATHDSAEPVYMIGVVVNLTQMHAQTIRLYERLGLVTPQRRNKNRLYSESDVERLRQIRRFTQEMGVNLAGVEVILDLLQRLDQLQQERDAFATRSAQLEHHFREYVTRHGGAFP
jgi:MerR family transcriptional regulator, heat shock protein HspR